jgi:type I restriction enzyme S subunit
MKIKFFSIPELIGSEGVFIDGDWVESKDQDEKGSVRLIQLADIGEGTFLNKSNRHLTKKKAIALRCTFLKKGDILVARMPDPLGRCCIFPRVEQESVTAVDVCIIRPSGSIVSNVFLMYLINSSSIRNQIYKFSTGTTRRRISRGNLSKIKLPIPPMNDQIRIATLLSRVEALIATRKDNLRLLDEFLKSTFLEMFGDPVRNEKAFEVRTLSEFYIDPKNGTKCGPFGSALKKKEYVKSGVPVWNMDNISIDGRLQPDVSLWITDDKFEELKGYSAISGDVIISRAGTVGKMCALITDYPKSIISTNLIRVRFGQELLPQYFVSLMTYCKGRVGKLRTGSDGGFTHMNTGILDQLHFPYPPIELQNHFASIVEKVESLKTLYQQGLSELKNLYAALSQKAFKGELDLSRIPMEKTAEETLSGTTSESARQIAKSDQTGETAAAGLL